MQDTCEKMYSVQRRYYEKVRRRKRKYEVLCNMWEAVVKGCREFLMQGDSALLQHFQGSQFLSIPEKYRSEIINEYIDDQEKTFANWTMRFRRDFEQLKDPTMRMYCKTSNLLQI